LSLPTVELELELVLVLELEELEEFSLVPSTPDGDVDDGIAKTSKASTALLEPPSVSGESLSSSSRLSVIASIFSIISEASSSNRFDIFNNIERSLLESDLSAIFCF
jgi:hypothetical protein